MVSRLAHGTARALLWAGGILIALGLVTALVGVYVGSWPIRRLARRSTDAATVAALQEALVAAGGLFSALRARR